MRIDSWQDHLVKALQDCSWNLNKAVGELSESQPAEEDSSARKRSKTKVGGTRIAKTLRMGSRGAIARSQSIRRKVTAAASGTSTSGSAVPDVSEKERALLEKKLNIEARSNTV